jgi:hypothetical protein
VAGVRSSGWVGARPTGVRTAVWGTTPVSEAHRDAAHLLRVDVPSRPRTLTTTAGGLELRIPSCGPVRSSPRCWSGGAGSTGRCSRW